MKWQDFEEEVRKIAASHWSCPAIPETIAGVKCDAVLRPSHEEMIVIEITKENNLAKLRDDLAKFATIRAAMVPQGIVVRSFFVSANEVSSLRESGKAQNVKVLAVREFRERFVGKDAYETERKKLEFGSAVDPESGLPDTAPFIPIRYHNHQGGGDVSIDEVTEFIRAGRKVILLGEFGTGKSRCVEQVFRRLSEAEILFPTFAINLRDHWGHQSFDLILRSHLRSLGLSNLEDQAVRLARDGHFSFLLDGFDEIGSQVWSGEVERLKEIRRRSLIGVRDLVVRSRNKGLLLCGREHYFSNDDEMLDCLGLDESAIILSCPKEFSDEQAHEYLEASSGFSQFPEWSPRKPLICQLFSKLDPAVLNKVISDASGEVDFFESAFQAICERETRIHPTIDALTLMKILQGISRVLRQKSDLKEEITPLEENKVFHDISGYSPADETASTLQRLPYLGRVDSGSGNRRFIDSYASSGICGIDLCEAFLINDETIASTKYHKPLGIFGSRFLGAKGLLGEGAKKYVRLCSARGNSQIAADYVCSEISHSSESVDLSNMPIADAVFEELSLSDIEVKKLILNNCFIEKMRVDGAIFIDCRITNCAIISLEGISDRSKLPEAFDGSCEIESFSSTDNVARISELPLGNKHKTLVAIIKKLFFQPGSGRKEDALLRGASKYWDSDAAEAVLGYLVRENIVLIAPGKQGKLYIPNRSYARRMSNLCSLLSNSDDDLWRIVS